MPILSTTCPECARPFDLVWESTDAPRRPDLVKCPHLFDGLDCPGMIEVEVPAEFLAVRVGTC
jgi:hypothetical protein